jgi:Asp-tRNA(Asn)/Glu-tRNA(Gln) amidotransferase A subunit family amidase
MHSTYSKTILFFFISSIHLFLSCSTYKHPDFSKKDVKKAQKVIGLDFSKNDIDTLYRYLGRNAAGYDTMRTYTLDNEIFPALLFDPHPTGFNIPQTQHPIQWDIPEKVTLPTNKEDLAFYSISQLASLIKNRQITSEELTKLYIKRIKKYDPQLLSVTVLTEELALQQAKKADAEIAKGDYKGLLHGIPYGVKDLMAVKDYKTTWGAAPYQHQIINYTAHVIQKLEEAGAVLIAKLTSGALARGDVWYGGKTKNPWDLTQGASGSSAGPGAATAAGLVAFSLGTETLGSIVAPSYRCGLTGLRPTYGRVSRHGVMSLSWSMDKIGPMCRSAEDCAIVFSYIQGADEKDQTAKDAAFNYNPQSDLKNLKVAYLKTLFDKDTTEAGENNRQALSIFKEMGLLLEAIQLPQNFPYNAFDIILRAEAATFFDQLVRSKGVDNMVEQSQRSRANSLRQARFIPAVEYLQANRHRRLLIEKMHEIFKEYDLIICPTFGGRQLLISNLTGHPAVALPSGFDKKNRPTSITLLGGLYEEGILLEVTKAFQDRTSFNKTHPPKFRE